MLIERRCRLQSGRANNPLARGEHSVRSGRTIRWLGANNPTPGLRKTRGLAGASGAAERAGRAHARAHAVRSLDDGMVWWLWGEAELGVG